MKAIVCAIHYSTMKTIMLPKTDYIASSELFLEINIYIETCKNFNQSMSPKPQLPYNSQQAILTRQAEERAYRAEDWFQNRRASRVGYIHSLKLLLQLRIFSGVAARASIVRAECQWSCQGTWWSYKHDRKILTGFRQLRISRTTFHGKSTSCTLRMQSVKESKERETELTWISAQRKRSCGAGKHQQRAGNQDDQSKKTTHHIPESPETKKNLVFFTSPSALHMHPVEDLRGTAPNWQLETFICGKTKTLGGLNILSTVNYSPPLFHSIIGPISLSLSLSIRT